jgi:hypothetical protein
VPWNDLFIDLGTEDDLVARTAGHACVAIDRCSIVLFLVSKYWLASELLVMKNKAVNGHDFNVGIIR